MLTYAHKHSQVQVHSCQRGSGCAVVERLHWRAMVLPPRRPDPKLLPITTVALLVTRWSGALELGGTELILLSEMEDRLG